jgi:Predicted transcription factor, homolog of eukaryotic MBF1
MQKIGKRLADLRKKNHFKQTELAEKLNVSQQVISNIERELTVPDIEFLKSAADLYKISLDQLVGRDFLSEETDDIEQKIISYIKQMDDKGKELSLDLLSQVAKHQGNKDGNE